MNTKRNSDVNKHTDKMGSLAARLSELSSKISHASPFVNKLASFQNDTAGDFILPYNMLKDESKQSCRFIEQAPKEKVLKSADMLEEIEEQNIQCSKSKKTLLSIAELEITKANLEREKEDLLAAKQELERSNSMLEEFIYMASHDMQEPLRMVVSYAELIAKRYRGKLDADADDFISYTVDGANRMQKLVASLMTYARVNTFENDLRATDCETLLLNVMANLHLVIEGSDAEITHDSLPTVMADEVQLVRVFQNLIENAIKFSGNEKPKIHISAECGDGEWIFSVKDNGIGINDQFKESIFTMFQRMHSKDKYSGTGIGLAICRKIVDCHGGRIWVESGSDKGSRFYFTIPIGV